MSRSVRASCKAVYLHRSFAWRFTVLVWFAFVLVLPGGWMPAIAQQSTAHEAEWIWWPQHSKDRIPRLSCYFRKTFVMRAPEQGQITIAADDAYELYLNGRRVGAGQSPRRLDEYDISRFLNRGRNVVAVMVTNRNGTTAAMAARVVVKDRGAAWANHSTNTTWKSNLRPLPLWNTQIYNDRRWAMSQSFGRLGDTVPWDREEGVAVEERHHSQRFVISKEFTVQRILDGEQTGSLIAMTINEFGHILASQESGPLLLIHDSNRDNQVDKVRVYCDQVKNCQGILALNGEVFVTADGPDGNALYRLTDENRDGKLEKVTSLIRFRGEMGEHGAHGLTLGPDGLLYVIVGNHSGPVAQYDPASPHTGYYEGDLVGPRYEDPGGHAVGMKVPGGVVLRTDTDGRAIQLVTGGLRNAYDLAFSRQGELFVHDSDMESDEGTPWFRPTRIYHITAGSEFGWRSGWAKWPEYFVDCLPAALDTGRGSPTGSVFYNHFAFPQRYHNALFLADWSEGQILAVQLKPNGASYTANSEVFLEGSPLNVTDLEVGPKGDLFFVTGGRGTSGGLYRVSWRGEVPASVRNRGEGIGAAIRQPQLHSAWGRQKIAALRRELGDDWDRLIEGVARSTANPPHYRTRAVDVMQLFGPPPSQQLLIELSQDKSELVRSKAAELMGLHSDDRTRDTLIRLLNDTDRNVRRKACEALVRARQTAPVDLVVQLVRSDDRFEAWAARRLLERIPLDQWRDTVLATDDHRLLIQGGLALIIAHPEKEHALALTDRIEEMMDGFISDRDFIEMLRLQQVALMLGNVTAEDIPEMCQRLAQEFPSGNAIMNRELVRLLVYLQVDSILDRYMAFLRSDVPAMEKLHLALNLRFLQSGWTTGQKLELFNFLKAARTMPGGGSYSMYVTNVTRDFAKSLTPQQASQVLAEGTRWPNAAIGALYKLPPSLDLETLQNLERLDQQIADRDEDAFKDLKIGIVAVLARSADDASMEYLREIWRIDPDRRAATAMGLAQSPDGENWAYLVRSLPILEGPTAREVLARLRNVEKAPTEPEYVRQVILCGLRLKKQGAREALDLLEYWTGEQPAEEGDDLEQALKAWQQWYARQYPDRPEAVLPVAKQESKWSLDQLMDYLNSDDGLQGSTEEGSTVFSKAQCVKCHRFHNQGESVGPDLTSVSKRFTKKEILESILFPAHIISDQFASKTVLTANGRMYTGLVTPGGQGEVILLQTDGEKITIDQEDIEETRASKVSVMPEGLLDSLTLQEISDLMAYLGVISSPRLARQAEQTEQK